AGLDRRRDRAGARVLRLRRQIPGREGADSDSGVDLGGDREGGPHPRGRDVPSLRDLGHGARRFLSRAAHGARARQRAQHAPRLHGDLDVSEALGSLGASASEAAGRVDSARSRAPAETGPALARAAGAAALIGALGVFLVPWLAAAGLTAAVYPIGASLTRRLPMDDPTG